MYRARIIAIYLPFMNNSRFVMATNFHRWWWWCFWWCHIYAPPSLISIVNAKMLKMRTDFWVYKMDSSLDWTTNQFWWCHSCQHMKCEFSTKINMMSTLQLTVICIRCDAMRYNICVVINKYFDYIFFRRRLLPSRFQSLSIAMHCCCFFLWIRLLL